jgi:hypothetical protein
MNLRAFFHKPFDEHFHVPSDQKSHANKMLSKCSNPGCSATFRRLQTGKLFRFDSPNRRWSEDRSTRKSPRGVEFFWLCEACAGRFTLVSNSTEGTRVISLGGSRAGSRYRVIGFRAKR